jgi:hypothetical protein
MRASYADFVEWRRDNTAFEDLGALRRRTYNLTGSGDPQRVQGSSATASVFSLWNLGPVQGRVIGPEGEPPPAGAPLPQAARRDLVSALKDAVGGAVGASPGKARGRSALVVGQLSLALSLLLVAGLAVRMALEFRRLDLGFDLRDLLTLKADLPAGRYGSDDEVRAAIPARRAARCDPAVVLRAE